MTHLGMTHSSLKSTKDLQEEYEKLDRTKSKSYYHEILEFLKNSIVEGDVEDFRKHVELLELINKLEKTECNRGFLTEGSTFEKTNVLLLACQYERSEHLKLIISNYCNVLYIKSSQKPLSPIEEDEYGKNAYYYLIRTSNIELLEQLIEMWPERIENDQMDLALSKSYSNLVIQNVKIRNSMKFFIEYTLSRLRLSESILGNVFTTQTAFEEIRERSQLITSTIDSLTEAYGGQSSLQTDEKFVYSLKFLVLNMNVLKRMLRCTYNCLPWEEMEFLLIIFITVLKSAPKKHFFYNSYIQRENLLKFLKEFGIHLSKINELLEDVDISADCVNMDREAVIREISNQNPVFEELYAIHSIIRDFHTVETLIDQLSSALESYEFEEKAKNNSAKDCIIQKCLLLVWSSMRTSVTSPNSSIHLSNMLWTRFSSNFQNLLTDMDAIQEVELGLSLGSKIRKHSISEPTSIKSSLQEILAISKDLRSHMQLERINEIIDECLGKSDLEKFKNFIEIFDLENVSTKDFTDRELDTHKIATDIKTELFGKMDSKLDFLLNELLLLIEYDKRLADVRAMYLEFFANYAARMDSFPGTISDILQKLCVTFQPRFTSNIWNIISRIDYIGTSYQTKMMININQILHHISAKGYENTRNITKLKYLLPLFFTVKPEYQKSLFQERKNTTKLFKKTVQESNCLAQILNDKFRKLRMILERCGLVKDYKSLKYFITFKGKTTTFTQVEMLLFDILTILQNDLSPNASIYNLHIPLLMGAEIRNYFNWGDTRNLTKILDCNVDLCVMMQCIMITEKTSIFPTDSIKRHPTIKEIVRHWNCNLHLIEKKIKFFESFESGNQSYDGEVDLLAKNFDGLTLAHTAVKHGALSFFEEYFTPGKKANCMLYSINNRLQQNILHVAAQYSSSEDVNFILKKIGDPTILLSQLDTDWKIPLHYAAAHATDKTVLKLLECYTDGMFVGDRTGWRPIHMAIKSNNISAFKVLLDAEKDINTLLGPDDSSLLHVAAEARSEDITKLLIDRGADVNLISSSEKTALHIACSTGIFNIVKMLVRKGANINALDAESCTPLSRAAVTERLDIVKFLLANNASVHIETRLPLLHSATLSGSIAIVDEILRSGADINVQDSGTEGATSLYIAVQFKKLEVAKYLLKRGANVNLTNKEGLTPLTHAIMREDYEMAELLLSYNPRLDVVSMTGLSNFIPKPKNMIRSKFTGFDLSSLTSVHLALLLGTIDILKLMLEKGVALYKIENWEMAVRSESIDTVRIVFDNFHSNYIRTNLKKLNDVLYIALRMRSVAISKYLMNLGATIERPYDKLHFKTLHYAILNFNSELVKHIIEKHVSQKQRDENFRILEDLWPLIVHTKDVIELTELFIKYGNIKSRRNLLRNSVHSKNIGLITRLIEAGVAIDLDSIFLAVKNKNNVVAKLLLEKSQIDVNSKDSSNVTLLHIAAKHCDSSFIEYLLSKGSEVNSATENDYLPIDYAAMSGKLHSVDILLRKGSKLGKSIQIAVEGNNAGLLSSLVQHDNNVDQIVPDGSVLHLAIYENSETCSYLLLDSVKINVDCVNIEKSTPLHIAASVGNVLLTEILVAMNADTQKLDEQGNKPVHNAISNGKLDVLAFYVEKGYETFETPLLHHVARTSHTELAQYLLCKNFDVNAKDGNGETALHIAARSSSGSMCRILIENGAYYNMKNRDGMSPGDVASTKTKPYFLLLQSLFDIVRNNRNASKVSGFIESNHRKICLDAKSEDGRSLLHVAVSQESVEVVQNLLSYNANLNITDSELNTPLHYAVKCNNLRIAKALLSAGAKYSVTNIQNQPPYKLTNNSKIKHLLLVIDKSFRFVADKNRQVCKVIEDVKSFEDRKMIVFGARNDENLSIYSYIVTHGLTEIEKEVGLILNKTETLELDTAYKLRCAGNYREASTYQKRIISKFDSLYGKRNPMVLNVRKELIYTLLDIELYKECFEMNEELLSHSTEIYGADSHLVAKCRKFSAFMLSSLGDNKKVIRILEKIPLMYLNIDETDYGFAENFALSATLCNIGWYDESLAFNADILDTYRKKRDINNYYSIFLETLTRRATILAKQNKFSEAYNLFNLTYIKSNEKYNQTHLHTLSALEELSEILISMGRLDQAINKLETLYELSKKNKGPLQLQTLEMKRRLMHLYEEKGDYKTARKYFLDINPKFQKLLEFDPTAKEVLNDLQSSLTFDELESSSLESEIQQQNSQTWRYGALFRAIKDGNTEKVSEFLKIDKSLVNGEDKSGVTPLHLVVNMNNTEMLELLIESGANLFASTKNGNSILHTAANQCNTKVFTTIINHVNLKHGERLSEFMNRKTVRAGKTALHVAAEKGSHEICIHLLQNGAIYNSLTKDNKTPIDLANVDKIKNMFNIIDTVFKKVKAAEDNSLDVLKGVPADELKACNQCRNIENRTLLQCASSNKKFEILNSKIDFLHNGKEK